MFDTGVNNKWSSRSPAIDKSPPSELVVERGPGAAERVEEVAVKVVKKDNSREPYAHEKIRAGVAKACWKRPISHEAIEGVVTAVANEVYAHYESEIESKDLGEIVMAHLRKLDEVAFVRFASVYRQFKDVRDFVDELKPMLNGPPKR